VFGNHIVRKRTHVLADVLNAIDQTADARPVFGLACGGRAEPYDSLLNEKIESFGLEQRLLTPGFVRPVENWMAACDVILAPAIDEPLARNVLEALALEVPVVVSTDGGLRELIRGDNGLLCNPYDIPAWITATRQVLDNPLFARSLAAKGRITVSELTPERHAGRVAAIYRGLHRSTEKVA
jgi:glycosyltransferase involved in cell wall biosynthesis